jgi:ABC-type lipoprotein release transport system permease subunit
VWEVITGGLIELWSHKLRSLLTLTLLMLGVFALVVMTSVLDGVKDKVSTGFAGMSWDATLNLVPRQPKTSEEQKRFAMSPGLRYEDLARLAAPHPEVLGFSPRATQRSVVTVTGGSERIFVNGVTADYSFLMNRQWASAAASPRTTSGGTPPWRWWAPPSPPSSSAAAIRWGGTW